jgi:hypothetical protein
MAVYCGVLTAADAARFHRVAASVVGFASDGSRYVAWQVTEGAPVVVLDTDTGRKATIAIPMGCELPHEESRNGEHAAGGRFLLSCIDVSRVLDARTRTIAVLPEPIGPFHTGWDAIGLRYVEGTADPHACSQSRIERECMALYDLAMGVISYRPESQVADLDRPGVICARLREKLMVERGSGASEGQFAYSDGVFAEPDPHGHGVEVFRCRGRPTLLHGGGEPRDLEIGSGLLTWDTGSPGATYNQDVPEGPGYGELWTYALASGRRGHLTLPNMRVSIIGEAQPVIGVLGYSAHTRRTAFWIAAHTLQLGQTGANLETSSVYASRLR